MGTQPSFNLTSKIGSPTPASFDLSSFPTGPAPASPSPNFSVVDPNPSQGGPGQTPYTGDVGGGYRFGSTLNPNFTGNVMSFLTNNLLSGGANPYTGQLSMDPNQNPLLAQMSRLLQGQGSSLPGTGNLQNIASGIGPGVLNQLASGMGLGSIPGMAGGQGFGSLNSLATGQGPGMDTLSQLSQTGAPIDQTPAWQSMVDAMQRQIGQGATNLKEQFNFAGGLAGSPFANSIQDYYTQSNKDLNSQLLGAQTTALENAAQRRLGAAGQISNTALSGSDILSQLGLGASNTLQNSAMNSALGLGGLTSNTGMGLLNASGNMGQYTQGLGNTALQTQYQDWLRQQSQYNPLLPMVQQMATTFSPFLNTNQGQDPLNVLIGSLPSLINSVHPTSLNFNPSYNPTVTASGGQGGAGGTSTSTAQGGAGGTSTATASPTIDPSMNPTFQNVPSFNVSPTFSPQINPTLTNTTNPTISPVISPSIDPSILGTVSPTFQNTPSFQNNPSVQVNPSLTNTTNPTISPSISSQINPYLLNYLMGGGGLPSGFPGQPSPIPPPPSTGGMSSGLPPGFPGMPSPGGPGSAPSNIGFPGGPMVPAVPGAAPPIPPGGMPTVGGPYQPAPPQLAGNPGLNWMGLPSGMPSYGGYPPGAYFGPDTNPFPGSNPLLAGSAGANLGGVLQSPSGMPTLDSGGGYDYGNLWGYDPYQPSGPQAGYQPSPPQSTMDPGGNYDFGNTWLSFDPNSYYDSGNGYGGDPYAASGGGYTGPGYDSLDAYY